MALRSISTIKDVADRIEIGRLVRPPLTTIETDPEAIGRQVARTLLTAMQGGEMRQQPPLPFTFRRGGTLAPQPESSDGDQAATRSPSVHPVRVASLTRKNP